MTESSPKRPSKRSRRETRRMDIEAAARALREGAPMGEEPRPPSAIARYDLVALALLVIAFAAGVTAYRAMVVPEQGIAEHGALKLAYPRRWLPAARRDTPPSPLARAALDLASGAGTNDAAAERAAPERSVYISPADPRVRIEVEIRQRPPYSNLPAVLAFTRATRHGEHYGSGETDARAIAGRDWFRTDFRYAYSGARSPRMAEAVEYAAPSGEDLYVVTLHGDARSVAALERDVAPTLTLSTERAQRGGNR